MSSGIRHIWHPYRDYEYFNGTRPTLLCMFCDVNIAAKIMAFSLWTLFEATLLCLNAVCVLNEERFLAKVGWASWQNVQGFGEPPTIKSQLLNLIRSIRTVTRVPLIFLNLLLIALKLVLG